MNLISCKQETQDMKSILAWKPTESYSASVDSLQDIPQRTLKIDSRPPTPLPSPPTMAHSPPTPGSQEWSGFEPDTLK